MTVALGIDAGDCTCNDRSWDCQDALAVSGWRNSEQHS